MKALVGPFNHQTVEGPSRGLLHDCEIFTKLREGSFEALLNTMTVVQAAAGPQSEESYVCSITECHWAGGVTLRHQQPRVRRAGRRGGGHWSQQQHLCAGARCPLSSECNVPVLCLVSADICHP